MEKDNLEFDFAKVINLDRKTVVTKRTILRIIAKLFNPLGLECQNCGLKDSFLETLYFENWLG